MPSEAVHVPADFFSALGIRPLFSMALVIAIPMYVCATGSIPIALSLMLKGLSPGTALVLLMAGPAANFASFTLISREMGRKLALIYLASIVVGAVSFGLLIDYVLPSEWFAVRDVQAAACHGGDVEIFPAICSAVLAVLLAVTFVRNHRHKNIKTSKMTKEYTVTGMNCPHCQATVTKSISAVDGVTKVDVNLSVGTLPIMGLIRMKSPMWASRPEGFSTTMTRSISTDW